MTNNNYNMTWAAFETYYRDLVEKRKEKKNWNIHKGMIMEKWGIAIAYNILAHFKKKKSIKIRIFNKTWKIEVIFQDVSIFCQQLIYLWTANIFI